MSYPRSIQSLVIEDSVQSKEYFETVFTGLKIKHAMAQPHWAFCFEDGRRLLAEERIYHLATIDLRLPEKPGQPEAESLEFGLSLIKDCADRNAYPIPAVLVISGHLGQTKQQELADLVQSSFAYGRVLVKSDFLEEEIEKAVQFIERYCDVGIHVRDGGQKLFPTLTAREEYLLRQCILADEQRIGVDLAWWAAGFDPYGGWTKTLMGRFLLDEGRGHSLYTFFKLSTEEGAKTIFREAEVMSQKLKHIKVVGAFMAGDRSLLVTQSAGSGTLPPISLDNVLAKPTADAASQLQKLADDVVDQAAALGDRTPDQRVAKQLLWRYHSKERLQSQWERRGGPAILESMGSAVKAPVELFEQIESENNVLRYERQTCLHGDLNYTNIAIEEEPGGVRGFIFDASGCEAGVCIRDIAMLEVTALLHQETDTDVLEPCISLYGSEAETSSPAASLNDRQRNTHLFIQSIRKAAIRYSTIEVYALMVFDQALVQLGGLEFGSAFNKIRDPKSACLLAGLAAKWYEIVRQQVSTADAEASPVSSTTTSQTTS